MARIAHHSASSTYHRQGVALLVVLCVIIAITIISLGFLARCDVELACGQNMGVRTQMDQLADSGLEHARGLLLHPQDLTAEYWHGATGQQLVAGSADYYDVTVTPDGSDSSDHCTYAITCEAYEIKDGERVGQSGLSAQLRLDPCIALWLGSSTTLTSGWTVHGDVRCGANLASYGTIDGDVFAAALTGTGTRSGQLAAPNDLTLAWPSVNATTFSSPPYTRYPVTSPISNQVYGPYDPPKVFNCVGSLQLGDNVTFKGMLLLPGDLTIRGSHVKIIAGKNLPALYVGRHLIIDAISDLQIEGLAIVEGEIRLNEGATGVNVRGGLFAKNPIKQTIGDSTARTYAYVYGTPTWEPTGGQLGGGALRFDGIDDYIDVSNEAAFNLTGGITVAAWIKVAAFDHDSQAIVTKGNSAWRLQRSSNTDCIEFACTGLSPTASLVGSINVNDGQWHHVAGVYDAMGYDPTGSSHNFFLYVGGQLDASASTFGFTLNNSRVMIGNNAESTGRLWNGWIDDVRIYDRALSQAEVSSIAAGDYSVANLVAGWKLDEAGANVTIEADPVKAAIVTWPSGTRTCWEPAAGAFVKSIHRDRD
jgi:hypothetical protein